MGVVAVKNQKIAYVVLVAMILIGAVMGTLLLVKNQSKMNGYVQTTAKVVDYERRRDLDSDSFGDKYLYCEIVEYYVDGVKYTAKSDVWTNSPRGIGGEMKIAYDPNSPSHCIFVTNSYLAIILCYIMSGVAAIVLVLAIVGNSKAKKGSGTNNFDSGDDSENSREYLC